MPFDAETIRAVPLFSSLEPDLLSRVGSMSTVATYSPGERLFSVGEHPHCLYVVRQGHVALGTHGVAGEFVTVEVMRPGDFFGTPAVLLERPSVLDAQALEETEVLCIAGQRLRELLDAEPSMARIMLVSMASGYRGLVRQIADLKSRSVAQRLGCYLLSLADEQGSSDIVLAFEKRLLASRIGTTPESLSRAFRVLRTCGVTTAGRNVSLRNIRVLAQFVRPDAVV